MAERDHAIAMLYDPDRQALLEGFLRLLTADLVEQRRLDSRPQDRGRVEQAARVGGEPGGAGEDRVADGRRWSGASGGENLGDEEGVAAGHVEERTGVDLVPPGHARDRLPRQAGEGQATDARGTRQIADDDAERVAGAEFVVPVGHDEQRREVLDAAAEEAKKVEAGFVGPVGVLRDEQRGLPRPLEGGEDLGVEVLSRGLGALQQVGGQTQGGSDVDQRSERARRGERVEGGHRDVGLIPHVPRESPDEGRLADPGLAADEDETAVADRDVPKVSREGVQLFTTLDQVHGAVDPRSGLDS